MSTFTGYLCWPVILEKRHFPFIAYYGVVPYSLSYLCRLALSGELHNLALQLDEEISSTVEDIFRFWEVPEFPRQPPPKEWVPKNPEVILPVDRD